MAMLHIDIPVRVGTPKQLRSPGVGGWGEQDACKTKVCPRDTNALRLQYTKPHTAPLVCQKRGGKGEQYPDNTPPSQQGVCGRCGHYTFESQQGKYAGESPQSSCNCILRLPGPTNPPTGTVAERGWRHVWMIRQRDTPHRFISAILASDRRRLSVRRTSGSQ